MSVLRIVTYPNPILKMPALDVVNFDAKLLALVSDMFDTMYESEGVGLAAPQINISERIIVAGFKRKEMALVNPTITEYLGPEDIEEEGCLSLPDIRVPVRRYRKVRITAQLPTGEPVKVEESGFFARILQHEIDHLNGILITERTKEIQ